jgi:hypothetical protein
MGTSFTKLRLFFHRLLHYQHSFPPLLETLCAGSIELFAEASELFTHAVFQLVVVRNSASLCVYLVTTYRLAQGLAVFAHTLTCKQTGGL